MSIKTIRINYYKSMYSKYYDIYRFLNSIKDKDFLDIIKYAEEEIYKAERGSYGVKGAVKKKRVWKY